MEVYSNHPTLQFYTGNDLPDPDRIIPPDLDKAPNEKNVFLHFMVVYADYNYCLFVLDNQNE